jgi:hypothetical protein
MGPAPTSNTNRPTSFPNLLPHGTTERTRVISQPLTVPRSDVTLWGLSAASILGYPNYAVTGPSIAIGAPW